MNNSNDSIYSSEEGLLKHMFDEIDLNKDQGLTFDELYGYLSKKSGTNFNSELLIEIFRIIDHDQNSIISLNEFIKGYSKAESLIKAQIQQLKSQTAENIEHLSKAQKNLLEAKTKKLQNKIENNLFITIKKAEGLKPGSITGNKAPIVCITCENNQIQTNPIPNPVNPEWNQSFTFPISQGIGDIILEVYDTERGKKTFFLGEVTIPLRALANQDIHEDYLDLMDKNNPDKVLGKILIALQWMYDLIAYLENMIKKYEEIIREDKNELKSLENYLRQLQAPLNSYNIPNWVTTSPHIQKVEKIVSNTIQEIYEKTLEKSIKWPQITFVSIVLYLLFSGLNMFIRSDFFNVTTS